MIVRSGFKLSNGYLDNMEMLRMDMYADEGFGGNENVLSIFISKKEALGMAWDILERFEYNESEEKELLR